MFSFFLLVFGTVTIATVIAVVTRKHPRKWWIRRLLAFTLLVGVICELLAGLFILNKEAYFLAIIGPVVSVALAVFIGRSLGQTDIRPE